MFDDDFDYGVNPANGLPMMDSCIDVMGNLYGCDPSMDSMDEDLFGSSMDGCDSETMGWNDEW